MAEAGGTAVDTTLSMLQRLPEATPHCAVLARPRTGAGAGPGELALFTFYGYPPPMAAPGPWDPF